MNLQSLLRKLHLGALGMANSPHVRLFDCLRAISGNQVLDGQELPCNNYGVKWQLATQEGICLLAAPSCSAKVRGHRLFRKSPFLKHPETGGGPDSPVYWNSNGKMGQIKPTYRLGENNCTMSFLGFFFGSCICSTDYFLDFSAIFPQSSDLRMYSCRFHAFCEKLCHVRSYSTLQQLWCNERDTLGTRRCNCEDTSVSSGVKGSVE